MKLSYNQAHLQEKNVKCPEVENHVGWALKLNKEESW